MADAVGLAAELDEPPVVDDAVDQGGGHLVVPEHRPHLLNSRFVVNTVSVNLFFTSFAKQARRSRKGGFTGCANVFSPIPVTA